VALVTTVSLDAIVSCYTRYVSSAQPPPWLSSAPVSQYGSHMCGVLSKWQAYVYLDRYTGRRLLVLCVQIIIRF